MKVSVCVTVKNEEKKIGYLLKSLLSQTKRANEIIIADAASKDKTLEIIRHFARKGGSIKILRVPGASIARGRNLSIEASSGEVIVTTDAGCIAYPDWLEKITHPFKHESVGIVAGFYEMPFKSPLQEAGRVYIGTPPQRFDFQEFMPSTRSVAFRKSVWEELGGFNEKLSGTAEDTHFFFHAVKNDIKIIRVEDAKVEWTEIKSFDLKDFSNKFLNYAIGDAESKIWWHPTKQFMSHNIKIFFIYFRYLFFVILLLLSFFKIVNYSLFLIVILTYILWPIWKWRDVVQKSKSRFYLPIFQIISDVQVMRGFTYGVMRKDDQVQK